MVFPVLMFFLFVWYFLFELVFPVNIWPLIYHVKLYECIFLLPVFSLQFFKVQVNCQDGDGNTGLMLAICYKKQLLVDLLLAR